MSMPRARRLPADELIADRKALIGLQSLPDYAPMNASFAASRLADLGQEVEEARQAEIRALQALNAARDTAAAAEWALHEGILGARSQVLAQYGPESNAVQLLGLKKKSERKRAVRRTTVQA